MGTNKEIQNGKERDILQQDYLKENPCSLPQNYFAVVEDAVREKIHGKPSGATRFIHALQTCTAFAAVFAIVFGLGYGAMYLTGTAEKQNTEQIYSQNAIPQEDTLQDIEKDYIEQYLIESNISITTLASLE